MGRKNKGFAFGGLLAVFFAFLFAWPCGADEIKYNAGGRRDPFIPLQGKEAGRGRTAKGFMLEGIVYDPPANSLALIGGQPYRVGDQLGDGRIVEIQKNQVTIDVNNEKKTLWIREEGLSKNNGGGA